MLICFQVSADGKGFLKGIGLWFALAIPSTYTNTMVSPNALLRLSVLILVSSDTCNPNSPCDFALVSPVTLMTYTYLHTRN